jgi:two-component system, NarL family, response regulator NreC
MRIRILVADGHAMFRQCLLQRLNLESDMAVVAAVGDVSEAVEEARTLMPDVVLLDADMPGNPFLAGREILRHSENTRLVYLAACCSDRTIAEGLDAGAHALVTKHYSGDILVEAVRTVLSGHRYFVPEVTSRLVFEAAESCPDDRVRTRASLLSPREREVLALLADGRSVKQVAQVLHLSYKTVDNQTCSIMRKLQVHSRAELVRYALREEPATV